MIRLGFRVGFFLSDSLPRHPLCSQSFSIRSVQANTNAAKGAISFNWGSSLFFNCRSSSRIPFSLATSSANFALASLSIQVISSPLIALTSTIVELQRTASISVHDLQLLNQASFAGTYLRLETRPSVSAMEILQ